LTFGRAGEFFQIARTLAPFSFTFMSFNTTSIFTTLHPESDGYFLFFLEDYKLDQDLEFSFDSFKLTFERMPHLSASCPSKMVFEHLQDYFHLQDSTNGFP
jgi:hypothetical protein